MSASRKLIQASAGNAAGGDFYPYTVENSARFNPDDSAYLTRTETAGNRRTWTYSFWVKRNRLSYSTAYIESSLLGTWPPTSAGEAFFSLTFLPTDELRIDNYATTVLVTSKKFRDTSAWYHILVACDTTQATASNRLKIYVNGVEETAYNTDNRASFALNHETAFNASGAIETFGCIYSTTYAGFESVYATQIVKIDGQALDPTSFGEFKNGIWVPKNLSSLTWGNNGFWLDFSNSGALGTDSSGNGNNWTVSGLTSSDQMIDTPTNNFATLNPLASSARTTLSDGNLVSFGNNSAEDSLDYSTIAVTSGKWYWEEKINAISSAASYPCVGVARIIQQPSNGKYTGDSTGGGVGYFRNGAVYKEGSSVATYATFTTNDVIGVALDVDNLQISFYKNGTLQGTVTGLTSSIYYMSNANYYNSQTTTNFGQTPLTYTPPTGALALCTANLPEPTIGPNSDTTSDENFNTVIYTGNGTTKSITGVGFQPDFTWIKNRTDATTHNVFDAVRGVYKNLKTDTTDAEGYNTNTLSSFDADGFTVGLANAANGSGDNLVAWNWKANGSGVSNTDGSITSTVSANQDAGFSIVTYAGTGASMTFGHGLGQSVDFMLVKTRNVADGWVVHPFSVYGTSYILSLNSTAGNFSDSVCHTNNSTVIGFNASGARNTSGRTYVAYCFAEVEGFSSFGSYTGNGSATDGPFVYTGFRPAFVMVKRTDSAEGWYIQDSARNTYNATDRYLQAESSAAGYSANPKDFLSNGFKIRNTYGGQNASGGTYIYMAFAENPFKYSNAR
jgi:hypothetical protein